MQEKRCDSCSTRLASPAFHQPWPHLAVKESPSLDTTNAVVHPPHRSRPSQPLPNPCPQAFDDPEQPYLPDEVLFRQKEQFSDGVGYDWVDGLKEYANKVRRGGWGAAAANDGVQQWCRCAALGNYQAG